MPQKTMRIAAALLILCSVLLLFPAAARGGPDLTIHLNGQPLEGDVPPYIDANFRTMVAARFFAEALGGNVAWDGEARRVEITRGSTLIQLFIDEEISLVNGEEREMDTVAVIKDGRTMVPLRFLAETFGMKVTWIEETRTVALTKIISPAEPRLLLATVTGTRVNIRPGPDTTYEPVIMQVVKGDELVVTGQEGDWYQVELPAEEKSRVGWIAGWLVQVQETAAAPQQPPPGEADDERIKPLPLQAWDLASHAGSSSALVMKPSVNIRASSCHNSPIIDKAAAGDWLEIIGERDRWYQVDLADGRRGWIASWLVATRYEPPGVESSPLLARSNPGPLLGRWEKSPCFERPPAKNPAEDSAADLPVITGLDVSQAQNGILLKVVGNSNLSFPTVLRVTDPVRMAFDFPGILAVEKENAVIPALEIGTYPVERIRAAQFEEGTVRIVADLQEHIVHSVTRRDDGHTVEILLQPVFPLPKTVVIDPGHATRTNWAGTDPGAIGPSGIAERDVVSNISLMLGEILLQEGYAVVFTRQEDTSLTLEERGVVANQSGGVFVSVHANAHPNRQTMGTMTFYPGTRGGGSAELISTSQKLANLVQEELLASLGRLDMGVKQANFAVLRSAHTPAVLVEVAFLSNPEEERLLARTDFQKQAAQAIARGIQRYMVLHGAP